MSDLKSICMCEFVLVGFLATLYFHSNCRSCVHMVTVMVLE